MILTRQNYIALYLNLYRRLFSGTTRLISNPDLPTTAYKPEIVEANKYQKWEADGRFKAKVGTAQKPNYSMVLPPPNVTGRLHLGHALACTVQDVIVRRKRSMGYNVVWVPGTDHAGIATQGVVEKYLKTKHHVTRHELGRENLIKEIFQWREKYGVTISQQLRTLGCSLDWSRETFTMDPQHTHAVNTAFMQLFNKGLIYRKKGLVNWCHTLKSTVSDIEVKNININGPTDIYVPGYDMPIKFGLLYEFAYPIMNSEEEIVVSTTTLETMLGDTAIAVHPQDPRYQHLIGKLASHPFRNQAIPIIADNFVEMQFGTGAVKITPAHSKVDYGIAKRHNLPFHDVISEEGLIQNSGKFDKLKRYSCRHFLLEKLKELGLFRNMTPHHMTLPTCSRTGDVIDQIRKEQWFLNCSKLNEKAADLVRKRQLNIEPNKFVNYWINWTGDDRDWCISRQLWWGHQIPAYKCKVDENIVWVAASDADSAKRQASKVLHAMPNEILVERDTDVLDTWFSSGIYPFATFGWPEQKGSKQLDYRAFYPLSLMATGHDILGFWVHRMVILGLELTGKLPFQNVLLHGVICDNKGAKMSKSRGNVIDPLDVINGVTMTELKEKSEEMNRAGILNDEELEKALAYHKSNYSSTNGIPQCGVDALRFTLLSQDIKSHYISFDVAMCHANKLFCNKIWQSVRYTQIQCAKLPVIPDEITRNDLTYFDNWIISRLSDMVEKVNKAMDANDFHLATRAIRTLIYNEFCDVYLEATKADFYDGNPKIAYAHAHTLSAVLNTSLRCLAPFMVYLTDELIQKIPSFHTNIICSFNDQKKKYFDFPDHRELNEWKDKDTEKQVENFMSSVQMVRALRGLYNMPNQLRPSVSIKTKDRTLTDDIRANKHVFMQFTRCNDVEFDKKENKKYASGVLNTDTDIHVEIVGNDADKTILSARDKLESKIKKLEDTLVNMEAKITSKKYTTSAPEWTQLLDRQKLLTKRKELVQLQKLIQIKE